jgi:hypothetical protein
LPPRILFLSDPVEDYVADSLFHGLRTLLGPAAVDFPKRNFLYASFPHGRLGDLYGRGFGVYGLLEDVETDRRDALERAEAGEFDLVVVGTLGRDWHWWVTARERIPPTTPIAVVDGADVPWMYPYGPTWWRSPRRWFLPRAHRRATYFKREWTPATGWLRWYGLGPPRSSTRLPLERIAISYPAEKIVDEVPAKAKDFVSHVVDPEVAARLESTSTGYVFAAEDAYLTDIRQSRFGVTTRKAGWDAMRHYEIAASGTLPCFRGLDRKPATCAPHCLVPGRNCLSYRDADDLFRQLEAIPEDRYGALVQGALAWARMNTTQRRAEGFLNILDLAP